MSRDLPSENDMLSLAAKEHIDKVCLAFEDTWRKGDRPQIETYLGELTEPERSMLLQELLLLDWDYRLRNAETPSAHEYLARFPDDAPIVAAVEEKSRGTRAFDRPEQSTDREEQGTEVYTYSAGEKIGRYVVERPLGYGGLGAVYLARDEELQRQVAIKVPRSDRFPSPGVRERFLEEIRTVARLKHAAIVPVYDVGRTDDGSPLLVMEYIEGSTLEELLDSGKLSHARMTDLLIQIAEAVHYAHRQGFVHRDLKPANVLIDRDGKPHIADFGLAVHESGQWLRAGEFSGTPQYMAPEQVRGETHHLDGRADVWALGVMLYRMLAGRRPFAGAGDRLLDEILHRDPKPPSQIVDRVPKRLERICLKCLAKRTTGRYPAAGDVARELHRYKRSPRRGVLALSVGVVAIVLLGLFAGQFFHPQHLQPQPAGSPPLEGTVDALVFDPADSSRYLVTLNTPGVLPLQVNDQIRILANLNRKAYVYVLWIDNRGNVLPVYPWTPGAWERPDKPEEPIRRLGLPHETDRAYPMQEGPGGMETLLLLARETPLPDGVDLQGLLSGFGPQPAQNNRAVVWFDHGQVIRVDQDRLRGAISFDAKKTDDPLLRTQKTIAERLDPHFPLIRAASFSSEGE